MIGIGFDCLRAPGPCSGGYLSAHDAQKVPQAWVRTFVILVGLSMMAYFFFRAYR